MPRYDDINIYEKAIRYEVVGNGKTVKVFFRNCDTVKFSVIPSEEVNFEKLDESVKKNAAYLKKEMKTISMIVGIPIAIVMIPVMIVDGLILPTLLSGLGVFAYAVSIDYLIYTKNLRSLKYVEKYKDKINNMYADIEGVISGYNKMCELDGKAIKGVTFPLLSEDILYSIKPKRVKKIYKELKKLHKANKDDIEYRNFLIESRKTVIPEEIEVLKLPEEEQVVDSHEWLIAVQKIKEQYGFNPDSVGLVENKFKNYTLRNN